jgi:hypothetical protein
LGFRVSGKVTPEMVYPLPVRVAALTVTATVPVEDRVSVCVAGVFTLTLPNPMLPALTLSVGTPAPNCNAKICATLPALAVSVTV